MIPSLLRHATAALVVAAATAHPAVSLVRDGRGNIYYSDLAQVWCLAPDGRTRIAVPGVHTHELCLDATGNLYGEHLWYEGDDTKKWGHYVWRRSPDGRVEKIVPPTEGFRRDYSFVRDAAGHMYWSESDATGGTVIRRRPPAGAITTITPRPALRDPRWLTCSPNGTLYTVARGDLLRIDPDGTTRTLARRLSGERFYIAFFDRHDVQGLCADDAGNVWVAVSELSVVKKISPAGAVTIAARSTFPHRPSGVLSTPDGHLWILEDSVPNQTRLRHLTPDGKEITP